MSDAKPTCFIAMPVTTHESDAERYGDSDHWRHVIESLFVPAVEAAGFKAITPVASGSFLIHDLIVKHLEQADMVLCDLSQHNLNVFFELGVRTSLDKPVTLVRDEFTDLPFDTSGMNTYQYQSTLWGWDIEAHRHALAKHLVESADSCSGKNPLWQKFGLTLRAQEPVVHQSPAEAQLDVMRTEMRDLSRAVSALVHRGDSSQVAESSESRSDTDPLLFLNLSLNQRADILDRLKRLGLSFKGVLDVECRLLKPYDVEMTFTGITRLPLEAREDLLEFGRHYGLRLHLAFRPKAGKDLLIQDEDGKLRELRLTD